jgi:hypothetical protein
MFAFCSPHAIVDVAVAFQQSQVKGDLLGLENLSSYFFRQVWPPGADWQRGSGHHGVEFRWRLNKLNGKFHDS